MTLQKIGVIGAGVMGTGVAQVLSRAGREVVLIDVSPAQLERAAAGIRRDLRMQAMFEKGGPAGPSATADEVLGRIALTGDYGELGDVEFVVENVVERWEVKEEVYRLLDRHCSEECVFAANTSVLSITRIGSATCRPDRVLGMHFMNPVPLKPVVEVIRGHHTSEETLGKALDLLRGIGKEGIVVQDMPGFVSNRVLMLTINEAIFVVQDGVAPAPDVDRLFKTCFGHKMGPLETGDLIGLDTILLSLEALLESYNDDKFRPCPLLRKMVYAGLHGRKSGKGFYDYGPGGG